MRLHRDMIVDDVMRRWPATVRIFLAWRMKCVGCAFGTFHTIADACIEHDACEADFLDALERAVRQAELSSSARPEEPVCADRG